MWKLERIPGFGSSWLVPIIEDVKGGNMASKSLLDKLSIYIPQGKLKQRPVERLIKLGQKRDRSVNYLVVDAIVQYLAREEKK